MSENVLLWAAFSVFVLGMLALDLGVFHRKSSEIKVKEALVWTGIWIGIAMAFNLFVYLYFDRGKALDFLTGYLIEKSLSIDNIFVILMIFSYFSVPPKYQHKVLFWGIIGALVMRLIFILVGIELIHRFHWLIYVFGGFLLFTGAKMLFPKKEKFQPEKNPIVKLARKIFPFTHGYESSDFFVRKDSKLWATQLFLVVILIEATDLIFAVDSIPAILAISDDPFIVYTSNVFALLGMRSLYFALAGIEKYFRYLKYGLAVILIFVGVKMCITEWFKIPSALSLIIIVVILAVSMVASVVAQKKAERGQSPAKKAD